MHFRRIRLSFGIPINLAYSFKLHRAMPNGCDLSGPTD